MIGVSSPRDKEKEYREETHKYQKQYLFYPFFPQSELWNVSKQVVRAKPEPHMHLP